MDNYLNLGLSFFINMFILLVCMYILKRNSNIRRYGIKVLATVTKIENKGFEKERAILTYMTENGVIEVKTLVTNRTRRLKVQDKIYIYYDSEKPRKFCFEKKAFVEYGLLFLVISILLLYIIKILIYIIYFLLQKVFI